MDERAERGGGGGGIEKNGCKEGKREKGRVRKEKVRGQWREEN